MKIVGRITFVVLCTLLVFQIPVASAARLIADVYYGLPGAPGGSSFDESDRDVQMSPATATAEVDVIADYDPLETTIAASAFSSASATDLKARVSLAIENFDPPIPGEGFFVNASARMDGDFTLTGLLAAFATPIFQLDGELFNDSAYFDATVQVYSNQFGTLFQQFGTSVPSTVGEPIAPEAIPFSGTRFFDFTLYTTVERNGNTDIPAGNYTAYSDFSSTISLLGFALFEDAAMTKPILGGATITGSSGEVIPIVDITAPSAVPVPAAAWLFATALAGLVGFGRRRA